MLLSIIGMVSNLVGFTSCIVISVSSFRVGRWGNRRALLFFLASVLLGVGLIIYGVFFSMRLMALLLYNVSLSLQSFPHYLHVASLMFFLGYLFTAIAYTMQSFKKKMISATILPLFSMVSMDGGSILLTFYVFLLTSFNVRKSEGRRGYLSMLAYFLLSIAQVIVSLGLLYEFSTLFLWGTTLRGVAFFPLLIIALRSGNR